MNKSIAVLVSVLMIIMTGCSSGTNPASPENKTTKKIPSVEEQLGIEESDIEYKKLSDPALQRYVKDAVYSDLVYRLADEGYYVENVETKYVSKEYLEELDYNSKENVYFGYTLTELVDKFGDDKYVFTLGEDGTTVVEKFQDYDDTYEKVIKNVAIGSGVILVCVTVSAATGGVAPAMSMVFAASAKSASVFALSSGTISGAAAGIVKGIKTKNVKSALKAAAASGSEGFKWGALSGALAGGATEAIGLHGATANGLSMNEAATIQKESKYPLDVIKEFKNMDEYRIFKEAGLKTQMIDGKTALVRDIDWKYTDELGRTNYERVMEEGLSPIDPASGKAYELHHIGQKNDATIAILTKAEHMQGGNNKVLHDTMINSVVDHGKDWQRTVQDFWKALAGGAQ